MARNRRRAATLLVLIRFGVPTIAPGFEGFRVAFLGGFLSVLMILLWWLFLSRAPRTDRWSAVLTMVVALTVTWNLNHPSMGLMWCLGYGVPVLCLTLVARAVASRNLADRPRRLTMLASLVLASGVWTLVRMAGVSGDHDFDFDSRFSDTPEEKLLDDSRYIGAGNPSSSTSAVTLTTSWPGFRGPGRDGVVRGIQIETDWTTTPPVELWRRPVAPGWSSFAVVGGLLYTQEQRGEYEVVACYDATTGAPIWRHADPTRFYESMGGPGPRATPTVHDGEVYTFGATGILNALDARDGALRWSRDVVSDTGTEVPVWGFSSSPLIATDLLIIAAAGQLVAYDLNTGTRRWSGPDGGPSYSSPHRETIQGVPQILLLSDVGCTSVAPKDGSVLWQHAWPGTSMVQPARIADGDFLISAGEGMGTQRIQARNRSGRWNVETRWTSNRLKPNFNDFVIHHGHAYGFDGRMLASMELENGQRRWKCGRYGHGQHLLLADQDLLLVVSEKGDLALVRATPEAFTELARFPAIEGKTWNHLALAGTLLWVRNGQEMAAFRLPERDI